MKFDDILEVLESDEKIMNFKFSKSQIPIYLIVRFNLLQSLINKEFNLSNPHVKANKKSIKEIFKYIYHTLKSNLFFAPQKDIYIFSTELLSTLENDTYIDRLYQEIYNIYSDKTQIIETSHDRKYLIPKKEKIYYGDFINIIIVLISKLTRQKQKDMDTIDAFMNHLKHKNIFDREILNQVKLNLHKLIKRERIALFLYRLFFKIKKPKMILVNAAFYGDQSFLIYVAKSLGIEVAEYQHGYIGLAHPAYNYHKNIFDKINLYFPQYLLTHGKYWSQRVSVPCKKVEIGLYELEKKLQFEKKGVKQKSILFISGGTVYKELNSLIDSVIFKLQELGYVVFLRPHPSEKIESEIRYCNLFQKGVHLDNISLYERLTTTEIIIGMEVSTVLFESVCFSNKVYMMDTKYTRFYEPESKFILFNNALELCELIEKNTEVSFESDYCWSLNFLSNYKSFIEETVKGSND